MDGANIFVSIQKVYYPLLCAMGIPANLFTFYMLCFRKFGMSEAAVIYLSFLAIVDTLYVVWVILLDLSLTFLTLQPFWHSHPWCGIMGFLQYGSLYSSSWIVVVFTIERYLVLSITSAKQRFTRARVTLLICTTVVLLSHLVSVPMSQINIVTPINFTVDGQNLTLPRCRYREAVYSTALVWVTTFLSGGIPIILVIIFNGLIAYHLSISNRLFTKEERRAIRGFNTQGVIRRTILLLCTVSMVFVVLSLPRFVTYCILRTKYNHRDFDRNDYSIPINVIADVANMLQNLNSTTNFLLYCMVSRRFRQELVYTLTCGAKTRELSSFFTQTTMKVYTIGNQKDVTVRNPVTVVLTKLTQTQ
ncbi:probable G-protein coupled receptor 139 [Chanos chanos]|uniref:Probable G-protein coupled receptor 139 n=1 Tax=Chanos chanos TaxID=29144 RepID=A0A6J2V1U2_CHACN|nr:probable G-protein coupled receptor 139 [Chanos chanos]